MFCHSGGPAGNLERIGFIALSTKSETFFFNPSCIASGDMPPPPPETKAPSGPIGKWERVRKSEPSAPAAPGPYLTIAGAPPAPTLTVPYLPTAPNVPAV